MPPHASPAGGPAPRAALAQSRAAIRPIHVYPRRVICPHVPGGARDRRHTRRRSAPQSPRPRPSPPAADTWPQSPMRPEIAESMTPPRPTRARPPTPRDEGIPGEECVRFPLVPSRPLLAPWALPAWYCSLRCAPSCRQGSAPRRRSRRPRAGTARRPDASNCAASHSRYAHTPRAHKNKRRR